ncbi:hypothetical protein DPEC_G00360440 [Dallia pectoralis]|uniref:Uncharacterized protein n=1 Tax=Dallia pectoralis TaxID=75939 RepID=A0ACC2F0U8_DALPE|nr:hypothetical protein DPEC_G00360440 [Dallia pectoralis]
MMLSSPHRERDSLGHTGGRRRMSSRFHIITPVVGVSGGAAFSLSVQGSCPVTSVALRSPPTPGQQRDRQPQRHSPIRHVLRCPHWVKQPPYSVSKNHTASH